MASAWAPATEVADAGGAVLSVYVAGGFEDAWSVLCISLWKSLGFLCYGAAAMGKALRPCGATALKGMALRNTGVTSAPMFLNAP